MFQGDISCLCSISETIIASASVKEITLWDMDKEREVLSLIGHVRCVNSLLLLPNRVLASSSWDKIIKLWDLNKGELSMAIITIYVA